MFAEWILKENYERMKNLCIIHKDKKYTYGELFELAQKISSFLLPKTKKGDRVGLLSENSIDFVSAYLACFNVGTVCVPINTALYKDTLKEIAEDSGMKFLLASEKFIKKPHVYVKMM